MPGQAHVGQRTVGHARRAGQQHDLVIGHVHGVCADQHGAQDASQVEGTQRLFLPVARLLKQVHVELDVHLACQLRHAAEGVQHLFSHSGLHATDLKAGSRVGIDHLALHRPHVLHAFDAPTIGKGKAQPGIEQRLQFPGKVGLKA